jgi:hypothetical protein
MAELSDDEIAKEIAEDLVDLDLDEECTDCTRPGYKEDPYPDYDITQTRVISGPLGSAKFPGTRYATWQEAKRTIESKTSSVYRFWVLGLRWFARIPKTQV